MKLFHATWQSGCECYIKAKDEASARRKADKINARRVRYNSAKIAWFSEITDIRILRNFGIKL